MNTVARLRAALLLFFVALAVPTVALVYQAYLRLQWETFHQQQGLAEEFAARVDQRLRELVAGEERRPFVEYSYFNAVPPLGGAVLQRSPLAAFPPPTSVPGLISHFQVDSSGQLSVPYQPPPDSDDGQSGLAAGQRAQRDALATQVRDILASNRLLNPPPHEPRMNAAVAAHAKKKDAGAPPARVSEPKAVDARRAAPQAFDSLKAPAPAGAMSSNSLGRVADLKLEQNFQGAPVMADATKEREEQAGASRDKGLRKGADRVMNDERDRRQRIAPRIHTFESEADSFDCSLLASGELVLFRKVWRDGQRYVQGLLIDRERFMNDVVTAPYALGPLAPTSSLLVAHRGEVLQRAAGAATGDGERVSTLRGTLLYQSRLSAPFSDFELIFSVTQLPAGPGANVILWLATVLALVLCGGLWLALRLGLRQLALARQQQEFIAAVSHELKTPLTSIRMYGEMLREGWAPEAKRQEYYSFIHDEAERLTRLINNVLNLARMTRNELKVEMREVRVAELVDLMRSKLDSIIHHAGRAYTLDCPPSVANANVRVDLDCFTQVMLNLVDNALKFSTSGQAIEIGARAGGGQQIEFTVRDFGPGVAREQMERIFALFYRGENALTRATAGTGIGLALVKRLVEVMGGEVSVCNREPGAEFCVRLPRVPD